MAVGRPIKLTPNIASKTISVSATDGQTSFTTTGGYRINELGVFRNGVRLVQGRDFTAIDGTTVTLLQGAATDDVVEFQIWDSFNIADALLSTGNQTIDGDLTVSGDITGSGTSITGSAFYGDGSGLTGVANTGYINAVSVNASGIITANSFKGDGSALTGVISGVEIKLDGTSVGTAATVLNFGAGFSTATPVSAGISTIETTRTLTIGVRSGTAVTFSISGGSFNVSGRGGNVAIDV